MAFCLHKKHDEIKRFTKRKKKKEEKRRKGGKKKTPVVNLMKEMDLHCHAALVSVLRNLLIWI